MVSQVMKWAASDGRQFDDERAALDHQARLDIEARVDVWLDSVVAGDDGTTQYTDRQKSMRRGPVLEFLLFEADSEADSEPDASSERGSDEHENARGTS